MAISSNSSMSDFPSFIRQTTATTAPDKNVLTGTTGTVFSIHVDGTSGGGSTNFFKLYDAGDVTHGTTLPIFCVPCTNGNRVRIYSKQGITISTALGVAASTGGGTAGGSVSGTLVYQIFAS
tara:strand:- start:36 stop:401 length:366 start_codon:yes stop_codon:yes gene_type:complete